jgi:eukaryotic-like serine/threonine-protein kinase
VPAEATPPNYDPDLLDARYRLVERLDRGGMATVWRAHDERLSRSVAIKIIDQTSSDPLASARMRREARALAQFSHPRIANVYDVGSTGDGTYLVIELVEGESLARILAGDSALSWPVAVAACAEVADALAAAHLRGVVHRDVSAANVMLTRAGVKLIDFGLSAVEGDREADPDGRLRGTPAYTAPERLDGQSVRPSADVYSLGVLLYRALAGRLPWEAATVQQQLQAQRQCEPARLPAIDGLPEDVVDVCMRCLARDPADRPSAADVADVLHSAVPAFDTRDLVTPGGEDSSNLMTRVLGWTGLTGTLRPGSSGSGGNRSRNRSLRIAVAWAAVVILVAMVAWSSAESILGDDKTVPEAMDGVGPPSASAAAFCAVTYQMTKDTGATFTATIDITNTGRLFSDGRLAFYLPGDQRIEPTEPDVWQQDGAAVISSPQPSVRQPGGIARLAVAGRYATSNPLPTQFTLDRQPCSVTLLGPAGTTVTAVQPPLPGNVPSGRNPANPAPGNTTQHSTSTDKGQESHDTEQPPQSPTSSGGQGCTGWMTDPCASQGSTGSRHHIRPRRRRVRPRPGRRTPP